MSGRERAHALGKSEFGDRVFWARRALGLSQEAFAVRAGIQRVQINKIEAGANKGRSADILEALARAMGQPYSSVRGYLDGSYGPPSAEAAKRFIAGEPPEEQPASQRFPQALAAMIGAALGQLFAEDPDNAPVYAEIAKTMVFHHPSELKSADQAVEMMREMVRVTASQSNEPPGARPADR
jgi:transcriptional regulator with XRE-family HTH domain